MRQLIVANTRPLAVARGLALARGLATARSAVSGPGGADPGSAGTPSAPTLDSFSIAVEDSGGTRLVTLAFAFTHDGIDTLGYELRLEDPNGRVVALGGQSPFQFLWQDAPLTGTYRAKLRAWNATGYSDYSNELTDQPGGWIDTFLRANSALHGSTSSDGLEVWTAAAPWEVASNRATIDALDDWDDASVDLDVSAGRLKWTVATIASGLGPIYILGRYVDEDNLVAFYLSMDSGDWEIITRTAGVTTSLDATTSVPILAGDTLELEITAGNAVKAYRNGVEIMSGTGAGQGAATKWGIAVDAGANAGQPLGVTFETVEFTA